MDAAIEAYPEAAIRVLGDRRLQILELIISVQVKVAESRRNRVKRVDVYEKIYQDFSKLAEELKFFDQVALPDSIREADRLEDRERKSRRDRNVGFAIGLSGIVIAIIGFLVA